MSQNLLADHRPRASVRGLLLVGAHIDTATARRIPCVLLPRLQRFFSPAFMILVPSLALLAAVKLLSGWLFPLASLLWSIVRWASFILAIVLILFQAIYLLLTREAALAPGANDNGSSVGTVLAAAEHFADPARRPEHLTLRYALWTAEERGLVGSRHYVRHANLDPCSTWVLNLDMMGTGGALSFVRGVGMLPFRRTSPVLNEALRSVLPRIRAVNYFVRGSDFKPFLLRSVPTTSLTGKGGRRNWHYHTTEDVSEHLQLELLEQATKAVIGLALNLDEKLVAGA